MTCPAFLRAALRAPFGRCGGEPSSPRTGGSAAMPPGALMPRRAGDDGSDAGRPLPGHRWPLAAAMLAAALPAAAVAVTAVPMTAGSVRAVPVAEDAAAAAQARQRALADLARRDAPARQAAVEQLARIGTMADAPRVLERLLDIDPGVRDAAGAAAWQIWSRSGDPAIDRLFARGVAQMQASALDDALASFDEIVRRKPEFAEGWNKRATVYFLLGQYEKSLQDCAEVLERNPVHFGALSGAGQIHLELGHTRVALDYFRRAFAINPNLEGAAHLIRLIEERLRQEDRSRT
jgi:tetratricopeptide (TPR) repeat protein